MIRSLRIFFLSRLLREKILLIAFLLIGVLIWASGFSTRAGRFWRQQRTTTADLAVQDTWLNRRPAIEQAVKVAASQLTPAKTLDSTRLYNAVRQLVTDAGIPLRSFGSPQPSPDEVTGGFTLHRLQFNLLNVEWDPLKKFYASLLEQAPYIGVETFSIQSRGNPPQHVVTIKVKSIENAR